MSEIEEIQQRDRAAIPRIGNPANDPLLRAEMDRRFLLAELASMKKYGADLIRQRTEHDIARTEAEARADAAEAKLAAMTTTWGVKEPWGAVTPCVSEDVAREQVKKSFINTRTLVCYQHNDWHEPTEEEG